MRLEEYLADAEMAARRFSGAYTGTSGTLAGYVVWLVKIVRQMITEGATLSCAGDLFGGGGFSTAGGGSTGPWRPAPPPPASKPIARASYGASHALGDDMERDFDPLAPRPSVTAMPVDFVTTDLNPKDRIGSDKLPLHLWPAVATAEGCVALLNGALKYGRNNWRVAGVRSSIYASALQRHMAAWLDGEEVDEEGINHLGSALACLAILVDARAAGSLIDDRNIPGGVRKRIDELTPLVAELRARPRPGPAPKDWTIADHPGGQGTKVH